MLNESDLFYHLYTAFKNYGKEPGILMGLRTHNDKIPYGEQVAIRVFIKKSLSDGDVPVHIRHFSSNTQTE